MADAIVAPAVCAEIKHTLNFDCGIYAIISPSGRRYIGQAQSIRQRWYEHKRLLNAGKHRCTPLQKAWKKYGEDAFTFSKIAIVPVEQLNAREQEQFDSYVIAGDRRSLYNASLCVEATVRGIKHAASAKAKMAAAKSGNKNPMFGRTHSEESRAKMMEFFRINGHPFKGRRLEIEERLKISARQTGDKNHQWGKPHNEDTRKKIAASLLGRFSGADSSVARAVVCIETGQIFPTVSSAEKWLCAHTQSNTRKGIGAVCLGKRQSAGGLRWRYAEDIQDPS